jgi:hypothetical protein
MARKTATSVRINPNVRALKVYPIEGTTRNVSELQTVGIQLSTDQAVHLAGVLLAMAQDYDKIDITGYRLRPRKSDGTYDITVTSVKK